MNLTCDIQTNSTIRATTPWLNFGGTAVVVDEARRTFCCGNKAIDVDDAQPTSTAHQAPSISKYAKIAELKARAGGDDTAAPLDRIG
ncbi:MAG: hypothetical protein AAFR55_04930 [Pseudomonadota bacterium]